MDTLKCLKKGNYENWIVEYWQKNCDCDLKVGMHNLFMYNRCVFWLHILVPLLFLVVMFSFGLRYGHGYIPYILIGIILGIVVIVQTRYRTGRKTAESLIKKFDHACCILADGESADVPRKDLLFNSQVCNRERYASFVENLILMNTAQVFAIKSMTKYGNLQVNDSVLNWLQNDMDDLHELFTETVPLLSEGTTRASFFDRAHDAIERGLMPELVVDCV